MSVRLVDHDLSSPVKALVDSGSEHVLAAPWLAADAGADLSSCKYEIDLGIGGANPTVKFVDMTLRLQHPGGNDDHYIEWECEVGFPSTWRPPWPVLLGQHGFFDRFTIDMHRGARLVYVDEWDVFDQRHGTGR